MATSTSVKPYVVPEDRAAFESEPEVRSGGVTFAGVVFLIGAVANLVWASPRSTTRPTSMRPGCSTACIYPFEALEREANRRADLSSTIVGSVCAEAVEPACLMRSRMR